MNSNRPTTAYVGATWGMLAIGVLAYLMGLWDTQAMQLNEKGYYFTVLMFGLYAAISLQKTVRDQAENIPTSRLYYIISWVALAMSVALLVVGLYNATALNLSEKGFYLMAYVMSLFAAVTIQKNVRDIANYEALNGTSMLDVEGKKVEELTMETAHSAVPESISERIEAE